MRNLTRLICLVALCSAMSGSMIKCDKSEDDPVAAGATGAANAAAFSEAADFAAESYAYSIAAGDLNSDGKPDLVVANNGASSVSVLINTGTPGAVTPVFAAKVDFAVGSSPKSVALGDLNGDGMPDIVVADNGASTVSILLNTMTAGAATPTFAAKTDLATGVGPCSVAVADLNGDGVPDIASANEYSATVSILINTTAPGAAAPTFAAKTDFTTGTGPFSVALGDLNGDGKPDLAVANYYSDSVSLLFNTTPPGAAAPTFSVRTNFATGTGPFSVALGDLNGDGMADLAVTDSSAASVSILLNTTAPGSVTPSFSAKTDLTTGTTPASAALGDLNGDGKADLAVANANSASVSVFINETAAGATTPSFSVKSDSAVAGSPQAVVLGDLNGDGKPDLAVANAVSDAATVLLNTTAAGTAAPSFAQKTDFTTGLTPYAIVAGDLNGDGVPDLAVANDYRDSVSVLLNPTAAGAATPSVAAKVDFTTGGYPCSLALGDINRDGKPDLAVANAVSNTVSVLLNTTTTGAVTPAFAARTDVAVGTSPGGVAAGDLNGDGKPDLVVSNTSAATLSVLLNTTTPGAAAPTFAAKADFTTETGPVTVVLSDLNKDGKLDIVVATGGASALSVLMNTTAPGAAVPAFSVRTDFLTGDSARAAAAGDLNGDGKPDLVVDGGGSLVSVLMNTTAPGAAAPTFSSKSSFTAGDWPYFVALGDLNRDGIPDLAVTNYFSATVSVLLNTTAPGAAAPSFSVKTDFAVGTRPTSVALGDLNGDGKVDIAAANNYSSSVSALLNAMAP